MVLKIQLYSKVDREKYVFPAFVPFYTSQVNIFTGFWFILPLLNFKKYKKMCVHIFPMPCSTLISFFSLFFILAIIFLISKNSFLISASFMICFLYDFACFSDLFANTRISFQEFFRDQKCVSSGV